MADESKPMDTLAKGRKPVVLRLHHVSAILGARPRGGDSMLRYSLQDVSLDCAAGTWTVLTGPPGAGTTSILRCAAGLDPVAAGRVLLGDGVRIAHLGLVPLTEQLATIDTLATALAHLPDPAAARLRDALHRLGLWAELDTQAVRLAPGRQRAAALALAAAGHPCLLLVDDLTMGMTAATAAATLDLLREMVVRDGLCVLAAADDLASLERADAVVLLAEGRVIESREMPGR